MFVLLLQWVDSERFYIAERPLYLDRAHEKKEGLL